MSWPKRYIEFVDKLVTEVQKCAWWFALIDCEIGVTSECENELVCIKPVVTVAHREHAIHFLNSVLLRDQKDLSCDEIKISRNKWKSSRDQY